MKTIQTGLRIPEKRHEELTELADRMGVAVNRLVLILIDLGLSVIRLGTPEVLRNLTRTLQDTGE